MFFVWLFVLLVWGCAAGFTTIPVLTWLLLVPFFCADARFVRTCMR